MFTHARRSSSGIIITSMFGSRFRHLQKLHTDAFLGLNAVCLPEVGLPSGAVFRSSLPATPVSTPVYESLQFSEQALRERLCKTPSPRKARLFDPQSVADTGLNSVETSWNAVPYSTRGRTVPSACPLSQASTAAGITSPGSCEDKTAGPSALPPKPSTAKKRIYVANIPLEANRKHLREFFSKFGKVTDCVIIMDHIRRKSRGFGFVTFSKISDTDKVLQLPPEDLVMGGRQLYVTLARDKRKVEAKFLAQENEESSSSSSEDEPSVKSLGSVSRSAKVRGITDLDDDILLMIFSQLDLKDRIRIERVCKRWQMLVQRIWQSQTSLSFANIFSFGCILNNDILHSILKRVSPSLVKLDLSTACHSLDHRCLSIIGAYCPNLEYLNLTTVPATNISLQILAEKCSKLKTFNLQRCIHVGEKGFWWIFKSCTKLESVDLSKNLRLSGKCFHLAGPTLKTVILNECSRLTPSGVQKLGMKCKDITALYLNECTQLDNKALEYISQNLQKLKIFHFGGIFQEVTSEGLLSIAKLPLLEELNLARNRAVNDTVIVAISENCARLRSLNVSACYYGVSDTSLLSLQKCFYLKALYISYLDKVSDEGLSLLANQGRLEELEARGCPNLGDSGFKALALHCPNLKKLDVSGCILVTNKTVLACHEAVTNRSTDAKLEVVVGGTSVVQDSLNLDNPHLEVCYFNFCVDFLRPDRVNYLGCYSDEEDPVEDEAEESTEEGAIGGEEWSRTTQMLEDLLTADDPATLFEQTWKS